MPATVVQSVMVPRLAGDIGAIKLKPLAALFAMCALVTTTVFCTGLAAASFVIPWVTPTISLAAGAIVMVIAKMAASISGGILLVLRKGRTILLLNTASMLIGLTTAFLLQGPIADGLGAARIIWAVAAIEAIAAACYLLSIKQAAKVASL